MRTKNRTSVSPSRQHRYEIIMAECVLGPWEPDQSPDNSFTPDRQAARRHELLSSATASTTASKTPPTTPAHRTPLRGR